MNRYRSIASCLLATSLLWAQAARASVTTDDFVAVLAPSVAFVAQAGDLAHAVSTSQPLRKAAGEQSRLAETIAHDLAIWRADQARAEADAARAPTLDGLGPVAEALSVPLESIARTASAPGYLFTRLPSETRIAEASRAELARLRALDGATFDRRYRDADLTALRRLQQACQDFVLNGDDPGLREIAVHALPGLRRAVSALRP